MHRGGRQINWLLPETVELNAWQRARRGVFESCNAGTFQRLRDGRLMLWVHRSRPADGSGLDPGAVADRSPQRADLRLPMLHCWKILAGEERLPEDCRARNAPSRRLHERLLQRSIRAANDRCAILYGSATPGGADESTRLANPGGCLPDLETLAQGFLRRGRPGFQPRPGPLAVSAARCSLQLSRLVYRTYAGGAPAAAG